VAVATETLEDAPASSQPRAGRPGVVLVFTAGRATCAPFALDGKGLVFGRDCPGGVTVADPHSSREHVRIARSASGFVVSDLGSRNGTRVDGQLAREPMTCAAPPVVRFGRSVALVVDDVVPFVAAPPMRASELVAGPTLRAALEEIASAAAEGRDLLVTGESGTGKELAARHFHATGARAKGPFLAVNCAAIPGGIAERLLFGAVKGAFSGASADAAGYVRSAEGGVLFLDEFGELSAEVQAKLLRLIETKEALPVGTSRGQRVDVGLCMATNRDLRAGVAAGTFRSDLYYRVTQSAVALPPLRARREEIPWLVQLAAESAAPGMDIDAELVEACMLRPWPGNVRELLGEIRRIAGVARARSKAMTAALLPPEAGQPIAEDAAAGQREEAAPAQGKDVAPDQESPRAPVTASDVARALRETTSVSAAARLLGIHRSHLYRLLRQFGIDAPGATGPSKR
jgi:DNA-binding NtrC family response regulator